MITTPAVAILDANAVIDLKKISMAAGQLAEIVEAGCKRFSNEWLLRRGAERLLEIIGEAANNAALRDFSGGGGATGLTFCQTSPLPLLGEILQRRQGVDAGGLVDASGGQVFVG